MSVHTDEDLDNPINIESRRDTVRSAGNNMVNSQNITPTSNSSY
jgi:hypothetical protein